MTKFGPPTIHQLARDCWLANINYTTACAKLLAISTKQREAIAVIYQCLSCEEERVNYGKVS